MDKHRDIRAFFVVVFCKKIEYYVRGPPWIWFENSIQIKKTRRTFIMSENKEFYLTINGKKIIVRRSVSRVRATYKSNTAPTTQGLEMQDCWQKGQFDSLSV